MIRPSQRRAGRPRPLLAVLGGLAGLAGLLSLAGCASEEITSFGDVVGSGDAAGYNVLLVTIDTARQDRFGCYGYGPAQTPTIDALAAGGVLFGDALATVPLTLPSHATILTGVTPLRHGVHDNGIDALGPEPSSVAETLAAHGYDTAAFIACFVMDARFGLDRGFDVYDFQVSQAGYRAQMVDFNERSANEVTDAAIAWFAQRRAEAADAPFFVWVHYFDPHLPHTSPLQKGALRLRPYDAEIAFVDQELQRLLADLRRGGEFDRTLIIVTADHGESLGEHQEATHGMFIYNSTMRVPLIFSCPSLFTGPRRCDDRVVGLVDLRPTIEDLLGIPSPATLAGQSLLQEIPRERLLYIETEGPLHMAGASPLRGVQGRDRKYIEAPIPEFYDLAADPRETRNILATRTADVGELAAGLHALREAVDEEAGGQRQLSDEEIQRLQSLGYVQTGGPADRTGANAKAAAEESPSTAANAGPRPDPKTIIAAFNEGMQAEQLYAAGRYEAAAAMAARVVDACPSCTNATRVLAFATLKLGRPDDAIALLREFVDREPDVFMVRSLAQALILSGDLDAAGEALDLYASLASDDGRVDLLRGDCRDRLGDPAGAIAAYEKARRIDPHRVGRQAEERIRRVRTRLSGAAGDR